MSTPPARVIDWDKALNNLRTMFHEMDKKDRNERDRARKKAREPDLAVVTKMPPRRCESCKRFCKDRLCAKCQK